LIKLPESSNSKKEAEFNKSANTKGGLPLQVHQDTSAVPLSLAAHTINVGEDADDEDKENKSALYNGAAQKPRPALL